LCVDIEVCASFPYHIPDVISESCLLCPASGTEEASEGGCRDEFGMLDQSGPKSVESERESRAVARDEDEMEYPVDQVTREFGIDGFGSWEKVEVGGKSGHKLEEGVA
jgi:hypothetical protein